MADSVEPEDETKELRSTLLETATSILQVRQRAEQEIRRTNEVLQRRTNELGRALIVLRATLESTTDAIFVTDEKLMVTEFNERHVEMWKVPRQFVEGAMLRDLLEIMSRKLTDSQKFKARIEEIVASRRESFDLLELKDGRILEGYSKVLSIDGQNAGRVWSYRDVTERHLAGITARQLSAIVASSDDAIIGKDLNSIITSWNAGAENIFGYTADEMIGTSIMRLIPSDRQDEEKEILSRIRRGERCSHFETIRLAKDGRQLNVSITVSPIKDSTGRVVGASKVARDITDRKRAEAESGIANLERLRLLESEREARSQAERASRVKDDFLATLSHELRTPLNAVLGWANILRQGNVQGEELQQGLDTIERNTRVQAQLIEDLLDMSRIISGKVRLDMQIIDLPAILNEAIETLRTTAEAKGVHLHSLRHPSPVNIPSDPNRLQQVFWNLLSNAIKFTPKGGQVHVQLQSFDSHVEISVSDTGEGIAADFLPYVFDRFRQGDGSTTRRHGGLGLGLAIVKQLVELQGGDVQAKSDGIGKGATFTVRLPIWIAVKADPGDERRREVTLRKNQPLTEVSLANVHVLVVDDELDARALVKRILEMAGATVSMAASGPEAMGCIFARRPDVLVCDIGMPGEDGYSFIRRLRVLDQGQHSALPAVALSAYARSEDRTRAIRSGFQNHLAKPVEPMELVAVVRSLADRKDPERQGE
jgi:PAS domain S-box-containing protein